MSKCKSRDAIDTFIRKGKKNNQFDWQTESDGSFQFVKKAVGIASARSELLGHFITQGTRVNVGLHERIVYYQNIAEADPRTTIFGHQ